MRVIGAFGGEFGNSNDHKKLSEPFASATGTVNYSTVKLSVCHTRGDNVFFWPVFTGLQYWGSWWRGARPRACVCVWRSEKK